MYINTKVGRPSSYTDDMPSKIIDLMYDGKSIEEACHELKICSSTHYNWQAQHDEYKHAVEIGEKFSLGWHLKIARENFQNKEFNNGLYNIIMQNKFGFNKKVEQNVSITTHEDILKELK